MPEIMKPGTRRQPSKGNGAHPPVWLEYEPLDEIARWPRNPKDHDIGALSQSMKRFGWVGAVVKDEGTGRLVAGHGRIEQLEQAKARGEAAPDRVVVKGGRWYLPVIRGIRFRDEGEAEAYLLADNEITILGGWREPKLLEVLQDLALRTALDGTGFDSDDVEDLYRRVHADEQPDPAPSVAPERAEECLKRWKVKPGQLWEAPSAQAKWRAHRILCGDATDPKVWTRLMGDEHAHMVFTDPPYGIDYKAASGHDKVQGDDLERDDLSRFLSLALKLAVKHAADDAGFYIWHASQTRRDYEWAMTRAGLEERQYILWVKEAFTLSRADYQWQHEPCFYACKAGYQPRFTRDRAQATVWRVTQRPAGADVALALANGVVISTGTGDGVLVTGSIPKKRKLRTVRPEPGQAVLISAGDDQQTDVWEIHRDAATEYFHPTQKPTELCARALRNSTDIGHLVADCFGGSGSTAVAAEQTGRAARVIELDPKYVAVTLERLALLGLKPQLVK